MTPNVPLALWVLGSLFALVMFGPVPAVASVVPVALAALGEDLVRARRKRRE